MAVIEAGSRVNFRMTISTNIGVKIPDCSKDISECKYPVKIQCMLPRVEMSLLQSGKLTATFIEIVILVLMTDLACIIM